MQGMRLWYCNVRSKQHYDWKHWRMLFILSNTTDHFVHESRSHVEHDKARVKHQSRFVQLWSDHV
jgi:hypothetical protein